jgi:hypothetical protein
MPGAALAKGTLVLVFASAAFAYVIHQNRSIAAKPPNEVPEGSVASSTEQEFRQMPDEVI